MIIVAPSRLTHALRETAGDFRHIDPRNPKFDSIHGPLISFQSGLIIPPEVLAKAERAYNFHGGTPEYPGRDPHHWAIYHEAKEFGLTVHEMTEKVDEGPILAVKRFEIAPGTTPQKLRQQTEALSMLMFRELVPAILSGDLAPTGEVWGAVKYCRADLLGLCDRTSEITDKEWARRCFAFDGFIH